ncbi:MAG: methylated-DNA-[protein]-cysteine S-methyltransferase [Bermanella sp.]
MDRFTDIESPIGPITLTANERGLSSVWIQTTDKNKPEFAGLKHDPAFLREAAVQLKAYFAGELLQFELALDSCHGTDFQQQVWQALRSIPFGQTASYRDIALQIDAPKAVRALGAANGKNPLAIVVPCHRVIGANGSLTGYAGGIDNKRWLLAHEARLAGRDLFTSTG